MSDSDEDKLKKKSIMKNKNLLNFQKSNVILYDSNNKVTVNIPDKNKKKVAFEDKI